MWIVNIWGLFTVKNKKSFGQEMQEMQQLFKI